MDQNDKAAMQVSGSKTSTTARSAKGDSTAQEKEPATPKKKKKKGKKPNNVRKIRIERMMSKAELARRANLSVLTIDRVEKGFGCRMDTKRKILEALGLSLADRVRVFGEEE
jgi:DNA-binding XRE family transcriptional regulator